jgi:hypothetical protein
MTNTNKAADTPEPWNGWIRGHWRIANASHYVRDAACAEATISKKLGGRAALELQN